MFKRVILFVLVYCFTASAGSLDEVLQSIQSVIDKLPAGGNALIIGGVILAVMIIWYAIIHLAVWATDDRKHHR